MSDYIVSARKYRPDSFGSLIGQDNIARTLKNSILRGQLAHAYLFCGPRGVGKTSTARIFAKMINCSNPGGDMEPCGECESCVSFREGRSYCIRELDAASNNGVEDIKALMDQVQIPPQVGKYSVYIIDEVHMLSQSAFNAFLKTLEEPPAHAIFILCTTEKHKIIPTILSRCQTYDFNRISIPDIVRNLKDIASAEKINADEESLHVIAAKADGAMRDALTIFDQTVAFCGTDIRYEDVIRNLNVLDYEYGFRLVDAALSGDYAAEFLILDEILAKGFNSLYFISSVGSHLRDLLVSRTGGLDSLLDLPDSLKARYAEQAGRCSVKFIYDALGVVSQCEAGYKAAVNQRLHIEYALMRLAFLQGTPAAEPVAPAARPVAPAADPVAPAAEPAPAIRPVTAEEKAPKTNRKQVGISMSDLLLDPEESKSGDGDQAVEVRKASDEDILAAWREIPAMYDKQPRLANLLAGSAPLIDETEDAKVLTVSVLSEAQKKWLEEQHRRKLEDALCSRTGSNCIKVQFEVVEQPQQEAVKYMPAEKAQDLMEKNPEVRKFIADLGLDVR